MIGRLTWLVAIGLALGVGGCKTQPQQAAQAPPRPVPSPPEVAAQQPAPRGPAAGHEEIVLTVEIPTKENWTASKSGSGGPERRGRPPCPKTECGEILGITVGAPHGVVVAAVVPDGPADKAGIKPGDSIAACNGTRVSCPAVLRPLLGTGNEPLTVELTIHRRKASGPEAAPVKGSGSAEQPE